VWDQRIVNDRWSEREKGKQEKKLRQLGHSANPKLGGEQSGAKKRKRFAKNGPIESQGAGASAERRKRGKGKRRLLSSVRARGGGKDPR